jgi:hypothetical protein
MVSNCESDDPSLGATSGPRRSGPKRFRVQVRYRDLRRPRGGYASTLSKFVGGCVCGAVRYECDAEPLAMFRCHCRDCQRVSGGAFSPVVYVPMKSLYITKGALSYYSTESMAFGRNKRGFCGECGSRLTGGETAEGIGVLAATLDDPTAFRPQVDIHVADAQPWDTLDPATPKFERYPQTT